jgi:hypothetical protein
VSRYVATTAADVSALARERLGPDNRVVLLYVPADEPPAEFDDALAEAVA